MSITENVSLKHLNTFGVEAKARYFCQVDTHIILREALNFRRTNSLDCLVLGGGSNVLLTSDYDGLVLHNSLRGIRIERAADNKMLVTAAGGENWHQFVKYCLEHHCYGLENLALIPGNVGAAPIQNIGAYGCEVADFIRFVRVEDIYSGNIDVLTPSDCQFSYRDSVFKNELAGKKIILEVGFELLSEPEINLSYPALKQYFADKSLRPEPEQVFKAVCDIRSSKLPDPKVLGNAGSFFKNPVITKAQYDALISKHPNMPSYQLEQGEVKVPAAWLIDQAGLKGLSVGDAQVHDKQALVIVNKGQASAEDITNLAKQVMHEVRARYDIALELEVQWIPSADVE
ncbi:MAG: UDP-N-acetylmuramate dehydrogenase [Pseudohongiellaceae bacterium]|nr:UDP-N-acetylmuramate dehydrogenase [Pseudohongiellaceae bacterium]